MITPMTRTEIVFLSSIRGELVEWLQDSGVLQVEDVPLASAGSPNYLNRVLLLGEEHDALVRLEDLDRTVNEIIPLLSEKPTPDSVRRAMAGVANLSHENLVDKIGAWSSSLREPTRKRAEIQDNLDVIQNYKQILEQVGPAIGGSDLRLGKGTRALVLTGDVNRVLTRLEERFEQEMGSELKFHYNRPTRRMLVGLLSFPESRGDDVSRILSQEGVTPVDMRDDQYEDASINEVIARIDKTLTQNRQTLAELERNLAAASVAIGAELVATKSKVSDELTQMRAQQQFASSQMVTVAHGWTPEDRFDALRDECQRAFPGKVEVNAIGREGVEDAAIPTLLSNAPIFKPFEIILRIFPFPTYGSIDPTVMVAMSFILFYGFIVGDVVYGLAILLFAIWLTGKFKHIAAMKDIRTIGIWMGSSSMIFGVLYGEYCGEILGIPPLWFHRAHDPSTLLLYAVYMGIVHMIISLVLAVRENLRHHHTDHAIERLGMLFGLLGLIILSFANFDVWPFSLLLMKVLAGVLLVVGAGMIYKVLGPVMGSVGVLEILSLGGNVISYARLMALGVAAIAIADLANGMPAMMGPMMGIPMAIFIHLGNIGISIASPTIHSLRLNFVEFLPKFYAPAGRGFSPFKKETQS